MTQRQIKFRAQRSDTKQWEYFTLGDLVAGEVSTIGRGFDWIADSWSEFTGLLDKNGKEIYEGDIIRYQFTDSLELGPVEWNAERGRWGFTTPQDANYGINQPDLSRRAEVIGDIYQNPELLDSVATTPTP